MKKTVLTIIPIVILVVVLGLLALAYANGRKGLGCDENYEPAVQAGKQYFQQYIDQMEQYKKFHGKYPENYDELGSSVFGNGNGFPNQNITGANGYTSSFSDSFSVTFYFDPVYLCPVPYGQARECTYRSETKAWNCD